MKFLYIDGKTKFFSGTKLRMWLVFAFFFFTAIAMIILELAHPGSVSDRALSLLDVTLVAAGGGGALYLGKRVVENKAPGSSGGAP